MKYKQYINAESDKIREFLRERVEKLANMLKAVKPLKFLSLQCIERIHDTDRRTHGLVFQYSDDDFGKAMFLTGNHSKRQNSGSTHA